MARWWGSAAVLAVTWAASVARAQPAPPPPAPQQPAPQPAPPPDAPPAPEQPPPQPPPQPTIPAANDDALVRTYAIIFSDWAAKPQRVAAIADPVMLDPRAVAPLVFLLHDFDPDVRAAAAHQLGRMQPDIDARIETELIEEAQMADEVVTVRIAAIEALGSIGGDASANALRALYSNVEQPKEIRDAAKAILAVRWPETLKQEGLAIDRTGRDGLIAGSSLLGSYTLGAVGALGRNDAGTIIGVLGGAVTGGVTAAYLTRSGEITHAQAGWMVSAGMWGALLGMSTAASVQDNPGHRFVLSFGLAGEAGAFAAAAMTRKGLRYSSSDVSEINSMGALAVELAGGALLLTDPTTDVSPRAAYATLSLAAAGGVAAGLALAPEIHLKANPDGALVALAAYEGTLLGVLTPPAWFSPVEHDEYYGAGTLLGGGLGILAGSVIGQYYDIPQRHIAMTWLLGTYGKLLGWSVPLLTHDDSAQADTRGVFLGSVAGLATGTAIANRLDLHGSDGTLVTLGTVLGGWHGLGLAIAAGSSDRRTGGWFTLGTSLGGLGTIAAAHELDLEYKHVQALAGGFFWGTWFSAWTAALRDTEESLALRATIVAGDAGLALGGLLVSPVVNLDARRVGIAYLGGLSGAALASLAAALATRDNDKLIGANLAGSGIGLALGAVIGAQWKFAPPPPPSATPAGSGRLSLSAPLIMPLVLAPPPSGGMPGLGIGATFVEQ